MLSALFFVFYKRLIQENNVDNNVYSDQTAPQEAVISVQMLFATETSKMPQQTTRRGSDSLLHCVTAMSLKKH